MIANWAQQLGWTQPRAGAESTAVQSSVPETEKVQQLEADIAALRQTVEQRLAAEQSGGARLAAVPDAWCWRGCARGTAELELQARRTL
jgi:hypothetical protein